jgi:hypothetical protein
VPAATIILAPIMHISVVVVEKLVVGPWAGLAGPPFGKHGWTRPFSQCCTGSCLWRHYLKEIRVLKARIDLQYWSND